MPTYAFSQVDVFGSRGLDGNPLAVVHAAEGLDAAQMQRFAAWTGLSETTFLLPPTTGSGSSPPRRSCRSPGTRPSVRRTPGSAQAVTPGRRGRWCRSVAPGL